MRIAIDARELSGRATGVGRYLLQLLLAWSRMPEAQAHEFVLCATPPIQVHLPSLHVKVMTGRPSHGTRWTQATLPLLLRHAGADVLFAPAYEAPIATSVPTVLSIHDVSFAAHPEWFGPRERWRRRLLTLASAHRAHRILTFSEFSKREIVRYLHVAAHQVEVTHHGVTRLPPSPSGFSTASDPNDPNDPITLYVGSIFNRRHLPELIDGFLRLSARRREGRLEIVGENRTRPHQELEALVAPPDDRVRVRSYLPDVELAGLYRRARAFVFLSEYEGFGMTPLEALAAGVPVLVLDTPVSREIYGPAALYLERPDPALIELGLERLLYDEAERARVLEAAEGVLARYSWDECAARTLRALASVRA
jgi:glycosyltransferase involved in cell wall biosynthesis